MKIHVKRKKKLAGSLGLHDKHFSWEVLPHPLYSPDIAPSGFHLFRTDGARSV